MKKEFDYGWGCGILSLSKGFTLQQRKNKMKREARVEYIKTTEVGDLYLVRFYFNDRELGHWPIHEENVGTLVRNWAKDGKRPM